MCNCVKRPCTEIRDGAFANRNPEYQKLDIIDASCDLTGWMIGGKNVTPSMFIPFTIEHMPVGRKKTTAVKIGIVRFAARR